MLSLLFLTFSWWHEVKAIRYGLNIAALVLSNRSQLRKHCNGEENIRNRMLEKRCRHLIYWGLHLKLLRSGKNGNRQIRVLRRRLRFGYYAKENVLVKTYFAEI